jgi:hypothetical protein
MEHLVMYSSADAPWSSSRSCVGIGRCGATSAPPIINLITEMEILALGFDRTGKFV